MAIIVKGDLYDRLDGKLHEIKRQMRQKDGYGFDPERLDLALQALVDGRFEAVGGQFPSAAIAAERGFTVIEDVAPSQFDVSKLVPRQFVSAGKWINGEDLRIFAREKGGNLGLADGVRMIGDDGGKLIPTAFQGSYIPLPGTLLRVSDGDFYLAFLYFGGARWVLFFLRLGDFWYDVDRLACSESGT